MSTVKYNIYYSTSPTGPWILANSEPVEKLSQGNTYTINDLIPGTQYYFTVVGGIEVDGTFYELISQEVGPNEAKARTVDDAAVVPVSVRTLPISTHGGGGLGHQFTVDYPDIARVQYVQEDSAGAGVDTYTATMSSAPTEGNIVFAVIAIQAAGTDVTSITQTGVTWNLVHKAQAPTNGTNLEVWAGEVGSGAGTGVQIDLDAFGQFATTILEYSGIDVDAANDGLDQENTEFLDSTASSGSSGNITTSQDRTLVIAGCATIPSNTHTTGATQVGSTQSSGILRLSTYESILSAAATIGITINFSPDAVYAIGISSWLRREI